jgi:ABC-2 type transport system ATP-binding protein
MFAIVTTHLTRTFGLLRAVDDLNIYVSAGSIFGMLGPNGAGKSTAEVNEDNASAKGA